MPPVRRLTADSDDYPGRLRGIPNEPAAVWVRTGARAELWAQPAVSIVGARAATPAGVEIVRSLAWDLSQSGILVVSGLARGIDAAAHQGALLAGGPTVAVLACGLDDCYPPEHADLAAEIVELGGALLSEWPAGTPARPWRFPRRNRLISALADIVVIAEGSERSGAQHTVRFAIEQGREVMAVPRDPLLPGSVTPNRLIRDGAAPVTCAADLRAALLAMGRVLTSPGAGKVVPAAEGEGRLLARLRLSGPLRADQLAATCPELPAETVLAQLVTLEVQGKLRRDAQGRYRPRDGC